mgnify:CR=1 FL=1
MKQEKTIPNCIIKLGVGGGTGARTAAVVYPVVVEVFGVEEARDFLYGVPIDTHKAFRWERHGYHTICNGESRVNNPSSYRTITNGSGGGRETDLLRNTGQGQIRPSGTDACFLTP